MYARQGGERKMSHETKKERKRNLKLFGERKEVREMNVRVFFIDMEKNIYKLYILGTGKK